MNNIDKLWISTGNKDKARELKYFVELHFPKVENVYLRSAKNAVEDKDTFLGNAKVKAIALANELIAEGHNSFYILGDDSGLCVDLLNNDPGVYSARYSGTNTTPQENVAKLLSELLVINSDVNERQGRYRCALSLIVVDEGKIQREYSSEGSKGGLISLKPKGEYGYAYDCIFLDPSSLKSYAEVPFDCKQKNSHRAQAFQRLKKEVDLSL